MLKLLSLLLIFLTGLLTGLYFAQRMRQRVKEIESFQRLFMEIESRIAFSAMPTDSILKTLCMDAVFSDFTFIHAVQKNFSAGASFSKAWLDALGAYQSRSALRETDFAVLQEFPFAFGTTNQSGQERHCRFFIKRMEEIKNQAVQEQTKKQKLCYTLGSFIGLLLCIIFV